jgi:hypothetical protein
MIYVVDPEKQGRLIMPAHRRGLFDPDMRNPSGELLVPFTNFRLHWAADDSHNLNQQSLKEGNAELSGVPKQETSMKITFFFKKGCSSLLRYQGRIGSGRCPGPRFFKTG